MLKIKKILDQIVDQNYSDIHICEDKQIVVRWADWNLVKLDFILDRDEIFWFTNSINSIDQIDNLLNGNEIDTSYNYKWSRYRINIYYDMNGINMALRRIPEKIPDMEEIWLPVHISKVLKKDKWLILVTWPTWSWKSTTVASLVNHINHTMPKHIICLEDPIEFVYKEDKCLINQRSVWKNTQSWLNWIKYSLRQDPDVIMIWEMRDSETIQAALTLVETWHLVISTLHTSSAPQTISRIINALPVEKQNSIANQLSLSIEMIISQRLLENAEWDWKVAAREIMLADSAISNLIRENKIAQIFSILEISRSKWMMTIDDSMAQLVANRRVKLDVVMPYIRNKNTFRDLLEFYKNK